MLSYQHAYHAGNPADVHKHACLAALISLLTEKPRGITVMETHAGRGLYDLSSAEARKTGEAAEGIERLAIDDRTPFGGAIAAIRAAYGPTAYPGSPLISATLLRPQDRLILMEKHPAELAALKTAMSGTVAEIHDRDGYEGVLALSPPMPRRGLVLIDPSYEIKDEYMTVAAFVPKLLAKWPEATVAVWYPVLAARRHDEMIAALSECQPIRREVSFTLKGGKGMTGSGLLLFGAPWRSEQVLDDAERQGAGILYPAD